MALYSLLTSTGNPQIGMAVGFGQLPAPWLDRAVAGQDTSDKSGQVSKGLHKPESSVSDRILGRSGQDRWLTERLYLRGRELSFRGWFILVGFCYSYYLEVTIESTPATKLHWGYG